MATLVTSRYATALFELATEQNQVEQYETEAQTIVQILLAETDFIGVLTHPGILLEEKVNLVQNVFEGRASEAFVGLMVLTVRKGRQNLIIDILKEFIDMAKSHRGLLKAVVTSAISLEENQLAQIKANIEKSTGKEIEISTLVDESILGGMIIRVGDKVVDGSIKGEMQALKNNLNNLRLA